MRTALMFSQTVSASTTADGSVVQPRSKFDEDAIVQFDLSVTSSVVTIQGRATTTAPWVNIRLTPAGDTTTSVSGYATIPLFPEMRASVTAGAAAVTANIWLLD